MFLREPQLPKNNRKTTVHVRGRLVVRNLESTVLGGRCRQRQYVDYIEQTQMSSVSVYSCVKSSALRVQAEVRGRPSGSLKRRVVLSIGMPC